jgi:radical SAM protein with 4Fe4S-binding SPASM domain
MLEELAPRTTPDLAASYGKLEHYIAQAEILNASQKHNARLKAADLHQQREVWESVPFRLLLEFNRKCNVKCTHCDIKRSGTGDLDLARIAELLDEIGWGVEEVMPLVGGEPTLAPVHAVAPLLRRHNIYLNFITNGILFTREFYEPIADLTARIQFSFHSHRREPFERIMPGGHFDAVVRNLRDTIAIARGTQAHVIPCVVVMNDVLDELPEYVDFVADLGIERVIFQKLYPHTKHLDELDPLTTRSQDEIDERLGRVMERANARGVYVETNLHQLFRHPENRPRAPSRFDILQENVGIVALFHPGFCMSTATTAVVEWDGTVLPCIKDHIPLGNANHLSFQQAWNGLEMQNLRRSFFQRPLRPNCAVCWNFYLEHP